MEGRGRDYLALTCEFWSAYAARVLPACGDLEYRKLVQRAIWNLGGCLLARVDGKSKAEYLVGNTPGQVRTLAERLLQEPPGTWQETLELVTPTARPAPNTNR
jgi:hypothetical protein